MARTLLALVSFVLAFAAAPAAAQLPVGEFHTPYEKWIENDQIDPNKLMATGADPVVLANGNLLIQETDLVVLGRGMDLVIGRSYRSGAADTTRLGPRWTSSLFESITIAFAEKSYYVVGPNVYEGTAPLEVGDVETFTGFAHTGTFYRNGQLRIDNFRGGVDASNKTMGSPAGIFATLKYTGNFTPGYHPQYGQIITGYTAPLTFLLRGHDGTIRTFSLREGVTSEDNAFCYWLTKIEDRFGNRIEYHYSVGEQPSPIAGTTYRLDYVLDTYGRKTVLEYDSQGWLWKVRDCEGREVVYTHDTAGNLLTVRSPLVAHDATSSTLVGRTTTYQYGEVAFDTEHSILKVFDAVEGASGTPYLENVYDSGQRVVRQTFGGTNGSGVAAGGTWTFMNEQAAPPLTAPTKSFPPAHLGVTTPPPGWWKGPSGAQFAEAARSFQIDPNGNCKLIILDKDGSERLTILFTGRKDPLSVALPHPQISTLVDIPIVNGLAIATGCSLINPIAKLRSGDPSCYVTERSFNVHGQVTEEVGPSSVSRFTYNTNSTDACQRGNLLRQDVIEVTSPPPALALGKFQTTLYAYEPLYNQVRALVDPRGTAALQDGFTHDGYTSQTDVAAAFERYMMVNTFDYQEQQVDAATGPLHDYVAYWAIDVTQAAQHTVLNSLDWADTAITNHDSGSPTDINGDSITAQWMGNVIRSAQPAAQVLTAMTGNSPSFTAQASNSLAAFNAYGLPVWAKDDLGFQTSFEYWSGQDPEGDGTTITLNPSEAYVPYTLTADVGGTGQGFLKRTLQPEGVTTSVKYDKYGSVAETTDPRGKVWKLTSNALGEKLQSEDPRGYKTRWTYDWNGSLIKEESQHLTPVFGSDEYPTGAETVATTGEWTSSDFVYDLKNQLVEESHRANFQKDAGSPLVAQTITTRYRYDKVGNRVLTITPEAVAGNQSANVIVSIFDERGLVYSESRGGAPSGWSGLLGHAGIAAPTGGDIATTRTDYHASGKPSVITDAMQHSTTIEYDGFLRLKKSTDPAGNCVESSWDCVGQLLETKQWQGASGTTLLTQSKTKYDERGRAFQVDRKRVSLVSGVTVADNGLTPNDDDFVTSRVKFDAKGRAVESIDDNGVVTFLQYDHLDRLFESHDSHGNARSVDFNKASQPIRTTTVEYHEGTGQVSSYAAWAFYDELGRVTASVSSTGLVARTAYDSFGQVVATSDSEGPVSGLVPLSSLDPHNDHASMPAVALPLNGPGNSTRQHYDEVGRLVLSVQHLRVDGKGGNAIATGQAGDGRITIENQYDKNSRLVAQKDDSGNATTHQYDALNRESLTTSADGTTETRTFDLLGHVLTSTDANGSVTTFALDSVYRVTGKTVQRGSGVVGTTSESYAYDGMGRVTSATDDDSTVTRGYDTLGNLLRETQPGVTINFEYDGLGLLKKTTYPGGRVVERTHDNLNRLLTVKDAGASAIASYVYAGSGRVVERKNLLTGKSWVLDYDGERRVIGTTTRPTGGGIAIDQRAYEHDRRSNKTRRIDALTGLDQKFVYDSSSRMLRSEWTPLGGPMVPTDYALDGVGNRGSVAIGGLGTQYALSGPDQPVNQYSLVGGQARTYDNNGNLVSRAGNSGLGGGATGSATATYDYRNQMASWYDAATGATTTYTYDCFGRRLSKTIIGTTTQYVWAGQQVIEERIAGSVQASYVHGLGLDEILNWRAGTTDRYFATDDMGSVAKLLDATGGVLESYEYGDFGKLLDGATLQPLGSSAAGNRCFYTGREHDWESGLHQHRMRYMEPGVGRFTTRDPIGIWGDASNAGNGYTYAASNPWTYRDPSGLKKFPGCAHPGSGEDPFALLALAPYLGPGYNLLLFCIEVQADIAAWREAAKRELERELERERKNKEREKAESDKARDTHASHAGAGWLYIPCFAANHRTFPETGTGYEEPPEPRSSGFSIRDSLLGALDAAIGAAEAVVGAGWALAGCVSPGSIGSVPGMAVMVHGADVALTGATQFLTGKPQTTASANAMRAGGLSRRNAAIVDYMFSAFGGGGAARVLGRSMISATGGAGLPIKGFHGSQGANPFHALDRAIERGVSPKAILDTVRNPAVVIPQGGGRTLYLSREAAVVLDSSGQAVTIWGAAQHGPKMLKLLDAAGIQ